MADDLSKDLPAARLLLREAIDRIEGQLRMQQRWEERAPAQHLLASQQPFCVDTLQFPQWIQWVLLPRLGELLAGNLFLAYRSNILAYASEVLSDTDPLLALIEHLDRCLNALHDLTRETHPQFH